MDSKSDDVCKETDTSSRKKPKVASKGNKGESSKLVSHKQQANDESNVVKPDLNCFCEICELQFSTVRLYQKHMRSKHSDTHVEKPEILTVSDDEIQVVDKIVEDVLPKKCAVCKLKFANSKDLSNHIKKEHQKEQKFKKKRIPTTLKKLKFSCTKCEVKFLEKTD